jgi:hypothetical protein
MEEGQREGRRERRSKCEEERMGEPSCRWPFCRKEAKAGTATAASAVCEDIGAPGWVTCDWPPALGR